MLVAAVVGVVSLLDVPLPHALNATRDAVRRASAVCRLIVGFLWC